MLLRLIIILVIGSKLTQRKNNTLSIRSTPSGFCFLYHEDKVWVDNDFEKLSYALLNHRVSLSSVRIMEHTDRFLLVPDDIKKSNYKKLFDFQFEKKNNTKIISDDIKSSHAKVLSQVDNSKIIKYNAIFSNYSIVSFSSVLAQKTIDFAISERKTNLVVYLSDGQVAIFAADPNKMIFANNYFVNSDVDIAYYILSCYKKCDLDFVDSSLTIFNEEGFPIEALENILDKYINQISFKIIDDLCE